MFQTRLNPWLAHKVGFSLLAQNTHNILLQQQSIIQLSEVSYLDHRTLLPNTTPFLYSDLELTINIGGVVALCVVYIYPNKFCESRFPFTPLLVTI